MTAEPWYFCTVPQLSSVVSCRACRKSENSIKILTLKRCVSGKKQCQKGRKTRRHLHYIRQTLPWWLRWERTYLQCRRPGFSPWVGKIPWRREWLPTPVFLPGEFHGQRNLVGYSPWGRKESEDWATNTSLHKRWVILKNHHQTLKTFKKGFIYNIFATRIIIDFQIFSCSYLSACLPSSFHPSFSKNTGIYASVIV